MSINGKRYGWEDISIILPHGTMIDVESIEYSEGKEKEPIHGKGSNAVGYGTGNHTSEGKLTMLEEEFRRILLYAKVNKRTILTLPPFPIVVRAENDDQGSIEDTLPTCTITKISKTRTQNDKKAAVELDFINLDPIKYDGAASNTDGPEPGGVKFNIALQLS